MKRATAWLATLALAGLFWAVSAAPSDAAPHPRFHPPPPVVMPRPHVHFRPGWRPYHWHAHYRPHYYRPFVVPYVYPYPVAYPVYVNPSTPAPVYAPVVPSDAGMLLSTSLRPTVSGPLASPAPGTAIIRVRVRDTQATVRFDGVDTVTSGTDRWFTTPRLPYGATYRCTVDVSWTSGEVRVRLEREVRVKAGEMRVVDFTRLAP